MIEEPEEPGAAEGDTEGVAGGESASAHAATESVAPPSGAPAAPSVSASAVRYNQRVLALGMTRSGKSELLNVLFSRVRCQRLLVDTKDEFAIAGVEPARAVAEIDWSQPVIHYIDSTGQPAEFGELFSACFTRRHLVVAVHELADLCAHSPGRTPPEVLGYINKGAAHGLGLLGASQRPVNVPPHARTEAAHVFVFVPGLSPADHRTVAETMGISPDELTREIAQLQEQHGEHAFLWWDRGTREISYWPPLPEQLRKGTTITRRTVL